MSFYQLDIQWILFELWAVIAAQQLYRVFKKEGEKVNGCYATKNWILGAI